MFKFKKRVLAIAAGALFAVPAFADQSAEGVIYQQDQTGAVANINQVADDGLPQAAAILQINTGAALDTATVTSNVATVIQGVVDGGNANVSIDSTGLVFSNTATDNGVGLSYASAPTVSLTATVDLTDNITGNPAFAYSVTGQTSNNYGLVIQNSQIKSNATVIQANSAEVDNAVNAQNSLTNADLAPDNVLNAAGTPLFTVGSGLTANLIDSNNANGVQISFTGGTLTVTTDGASPLALDPAATFASADAAPTGGNIALIQQGNELAFTIVNPGIGNNAVDAVDSFNGDGGDTSNVALAIQDGTNGYVSIGQQGFLNTAAVIQAGDSNLAETYQYDDGNGSPNNLFSLIAQVGNSNVAQVYQAGAFNSSSVYQIGDGHVALVDQNVAATGAGQGAVAFIYQSGPDAGGPGAVQGQGNFASIYQHGTGL